MRCRVRRLGPLVAVLWVSVVPGSGALPASVRVEIIPELLPSEPQQAVITLNATSSDGWSAATTVAVDAQLTTPFRPARRVVRR